MPRARSPPARGAMATTVMTHAAREAVRGASTAEGARTSACEHACAANSTASAADASLLAPLPPSWSDVDYDVIIVGAGPTGLACANSVVMARARAAPRVPSAQRCFAPCRAC